MKKLSVLALALLASGCASITRGTTDNVVIQYTPDDAKVVTSLGIACASSPCTVNVNRKTPFSVTASKDGYTSQTVEVKVGVSGKGAAGFAGNVLAGGVIGMGIDAATGATLSHKPNPVIINLVPVDETAVIDAVPSIDPASPVSDTADVTTPTS